MQFRVIVVTGTARPPATNQHTDRTDYNTLRSSARSVMICVLLLYIYYSFLPNSVPGFQRAPTYYLLSNFVRLYTLRIASCDGISPMLRSLPSPRWQPVIVRMCALADTDCMLALCY